MDKEKNGGGGGLIPVSDPQAVGRDAKSQGVRRRRVGGGGGGVIPVCAAPGCGQKEMS